MRECYDVKVYLDPDPDLRIRWKIQRDTAKRGYTREQVVKQLQDRAQDSPAFIHPQRTFADIVINFLPPEEDLEETGAHLNVRHILRPTLPHPDLTPILESGARNGIHLELARDLDGKPVDVLEIAGHIDDRSARRVEELLWELIPEAGHLREHVGAFADRTNQQAKSYPLALTQLLIAYHMVKAAMGVHAGLRETTMISHARALEADVLATEQNASPSEMANALRALAMDAVESAKSGHPGMPMGMADVATVLWTRFLEYDPNGTRLARPRPLRAVGRPRLDAAVRAAHLTGYDMTLDELKSFRQLGAAHAGPPRVRPSRPASRPRPDRSARASPTRSAWRSPSACWPRASTAGQLRRPPHLRASRATATSWKGSATRHARSPATSASAELIVLLRRQRHLDRRADLARLLGRCARRASRPTAGTCGGVDGHDMRGGRRGRSRPRSAETARPSLIACRTVIGFGAPTKQGTADDPRRAARRGRDRSGTRAARLAASARSWCRSECSPHGVLPARAAPSARKAWQRRLERGRCVGAPPISSGALAGELPAAGRRRSPTLRARLVAERPTWPRARRRGVLKGSTEAMPELVGGSADLAGSNNTKIEKHGAFDAPDARRPQHPLRRARARDGRDHERHRSARRLHPLRRDVPDLLGLHAGRRSGWRR